MPKPTHEGSVTTDSRTDDGRGHHAVTPLRRDQFTQGGEVDGLCSVTVTQELKLPTETRYEMRTMSVSVTLPCTADRIEQAADAALAIATRRLAGMERLERTLIEEAKS